METVFFDPLLVSARFNNFEKKLEAKLLALHNDLELNLKSRHENLEAKLLAQYEELEKQLASRFAQSGLPNLGGPNPGNQLFGRTEKFQAKSIHSNENSPSSITVVPSSDQRPNFNSNIVLGHPEQFPPSVFQQLSPPYENFVEWGEPPVNERVPGEINGQVRAINDKVIFYASEQAFFAWAVKHRFPKEIITIIIQKLDKAVIIKDKDKTRYEIDFNPNPRFKSCTFNKALEQTDHVPGNLVFK